MRFRFVHISDLHHRADWPEEVDLVCAKFFEDLQPQLQGAGNTFLVFSGDLVFAGAETNLYENFATKFSAALEKAGLPQERRICVPGNHDVSKDALQVHVDLLKGSLSDIQDECVFNENLQQLSKHFLSSHFANYRSHEVAFANFTCCQSNVGGSGWELSDQVGVYCLNTALTSFAGIVDKKTGKPISDKNKLMVDTRSLHSWLAENKSPIRILVLHHPLDWLHDWAKLELERVIANNFHVVFSGHIHEGSATFSSRGAGTSVYCAAPPLFTRKKDLLGYAFIDVDTSNQNIEVSYRQWSPTQKFVAGSSLAGNDSGKILFARNLALFIPVDAQPSTPITADTLEILQAEFDEATTCYSSKKRLWVDRDLANYPELDSETDGIVLQSPSEIIKSLKNCIIRAPKQYGLTCLGRFMALEHHRHFNNGATLAMLDASKLPNHKSGIIEHVEARCRELRIQSKSLAGLILDNWHGDQAKHRMLRELRSAYSTIPVIVLQSMDDCAQIANAIEIDDKESYQSLYLWALTRSRIRELVASSLRF